MTSPSERWGHVRALFERALEENPADLPAWLDGLGVADEDLRAEVLSLLQHHSRAGSFLAAPVADHVPDLLGTARPLTPGQTLGKYTIVRELGRGGMGQVYLAIDDLHRQVALKALAPELARDPVHRERLRREARAAAALRHPGICTVYALEEIGDDLFIASEFIEGRTLHDEIRAGTQPAVVDVERTARQLAAALAAAHEGGITHRDLKPENVIRASGGMLKVLDFGLAHFENAGGATAAAQTQLTRTGVMMGTPVYMAPEQLNGAHAGARTDVFAFGMLIYEYAAGRHPFEADAPLAVVGRILEADPAPLDTWRPDLPAVLLRTVGRCLRKTPQDRFASAVDLLRALGDGRSIDAPTRAVGWWRTHQLAVIGLYFLACALSWQVKEWLPGPATALFFAAGVAATVGSLFRGHLLFVERLHRTGLHAERRRARPVTLATDLGLALALAVDGALLATGRPLPAILTMALGIGLALTRLVVEPATTAASFPGDPA
jgi:predicted Ser/Thr protein kinase